MVLTRAGAAHLDVLVELCRSYCELDHHHFDEVRTRAGLGPLLESDRHGVVWLIGSESDPGGYAVVTWGWSVEGGGAEALLDEIYVHDRGQGVGSAAVVSILDDCRERGMIRVFLETESHNEQARRLYTRLGFVTEESVWMSREL
ncbi:MAG: GNAT family N-acetyltransferase [Acidimicrobiia bacterium]